VETAGTRPLISTRRTESTEPAEPPAPNVTVPRRPALAGDYLAPLGPEVVRQASSLVVSFESPSRQRRLTIAFRVFLALPHLVYLCVLAVVATLAAIVGWFCAL